MLFTGVFTSFRWKDERNGTKTLYNCLIKLSIKIKNYVKNSRFQRVLFYMGDIMQYYKNFKDKQKQLRGISKCESHSFITISKNSVFVTYKCSKCGYREKKKKNGEKVGD